MQSHNPHQNPFRLQDHPDQRNADARAQHHGGDTGLAFGPRHCCAGQTREEPGHSRNSGRTSASHRDGHHCQPRRHHRQRHSERSHDGHWSNQRTGHDIGDEGIRSKLWLKCHNDGPAQQLGGERNGHSGSHPSGTREGIQEARRLARSTIPSVASTDRRNPAFAAMVGSRSNRIAVATQRNVRERPRRPPTMAANPTAPMTAARTTLGSGPTMRTNPARPHAAMAAANGRDSRSDRASRMNAPRTRLQLAPDTVRNTEGC